MLHKLARGGSSVLEDVNAVDPIQSIASCPLAIDLLDTNLCRLHFRLDHATRPSLS